MKIIKQKAADKYMEILSETDRGESPTPQEEQKMDFINPR